MAVRKRFATLNDVAKTWESLAKAASPFKTGTMRSSLNVIPSMGSKKNAILTLKAVYYTIFWQDPAGPRSRTKHRKEFNFTNKTADSPEVKKMVLSYTAGIAEEKVDAFFNRLKKIYNKK
jgi:hypothetical protein